MSTKSLYERLGGYDGIHGFCTDLLTRLQGDSQLERFWEDRGDDGLAREKQLLIDFLCNVTGGSMVYTGRDMITTHKGMKISEYDWGCFMTHAGATMKALKVPKKECDEIVAFVLSIKDDIVEA